ncbi:MAG: hydratase, partial [Pseudomonadota bacterium]
GRLLIGPRTPVTPEGCAALAETPVRLSKSGAAIEDGVGANALDGPLSALRHLVELLAADPDAEPLRAGDVISTGTLTDAQPVAAGEVWRAEFGAPLGAIELTLTA